MKERTEIIKQNQNYDVYEDFDIKQNETNSKNNYLFSQKKLIKLVILSIIILICLIIIYYLLKIYIINLNMESNSNDFNLENELINKNYSFKAIYFTDSNNQKIFLCRNISLEIIEIIIDGKKEKPSIEYKFPLKGDHIVYMLLKIPKDNNSLHGIFSGITHLKSIYFFPSFDTKNINIMGYTFFGCSSLTSIDLSNFNTENIINMENMFLGCSSYLFQILIQKM